MSKSSIEIFSERALTLIDAEAVLTQLDDSSQHAEGPVYIPDDGSVVWSDVKGNRLCRWHQGKTSVIRASAHFQNGNALDLEGRIVACSHGDSPEGIRADIVRPRGSHAVQNPDGEEAVGWRLGIAGCGGWPTSHESACNSCH